MISVVEPLEGCSLKRGILAVHRRGVKWRKPINDIDVLLRDKSCETVDDGKLSSCVSVLKVPQVWERF